MRIGSLELRDDLSPADWIIDRIHDLAVDVGSVIPEGFDGYARLFHPAIRIDEDEETVVRWSEVAEANGRAVHPQMQWHLISGVGYRSGQNSPGLWDLAPEVGSLPRQHMEPLVDLLSRHTSTPDRVWFGVWDGFGGLKIRPGGTAVPEWGQPKPKPRLVRRLPLAPTFQLPKRAYYLLSGPLTGLHESMCEGQRWQSANLCWPEDRSWCIATEIDLEWTYVGGDMVMIQTLLDEPGLEAVPVQITDGIGSESVQPRPPPLAP